MRLFWDAIASHPQWKHLRSRRIAFHCFRKKLLIEPSINRMNHSDRPHALQISSLHGTRPSGLRTLLCVHRTRRSERKGDAATRSKNDVTFSARDASSAAQRRLVLGI